MVSIYCNESVASALNLDAPSQIVGKTDYDLIWREQAALYIAGDLKVINGLPIVNVIEPQFQNKGLKKILISKNRLLNRQNKCIGVIGSYVDVSNYFIKPKSISLTVKNRRIYLGKHFNNEYVTKREASVLKGILMGYSIKQIARMLSISPKTVESHAQKIKYKLQCYSMGNIVDVAIRTGLTFSILDLDFI